MTQRTMQTVPHVSSRPCGGCEYRACLVIETVEVMTSSTLITNGKATAPMRPVEAHVLCFHCLRRERLGPDPEDPMKWIMVEVLEVGMVEVHAPFDDSGFVYEHDFDRRQDEARRLGQSIDDVDPTDPPILNRSI